MAQHMKSWLVLILLGAAVLGAAAWAQEPEEMPGNPPPAAAQPPAAAVPSPGASSDTNAVAAAAPPPITLTPEEMKAPFTGSFFFTQAEITAMKLAMAGKPGEGLADGEISMVPLSMIPAHRVISVSGLLYRSPKDWVAWINGQKVTPDKLLPEIVDIKVDSSSQVKLKWYDLGLNKVIVIAMRPHQTYDIPNGMLLPGSE